jgi:NADP-dependent 3-hydroxy acid dehydrogenase YdfG
MNKGRNIWITGAGSGIGRALTTTFVNRGDTVFATGRRKENLETLTSELADAPGRVVTAACDVRIADQITHTAQRIHSELGSLEILINNAGVTYFKDFESTTLQDFDEVIETNLRGLFLTTKEVLPAMLQKGSGTIINILSYAGKSVYTGSSAYAASKAGAEAMMNVIRAETREKGIKVVNVYPGATLTPIWHPKYQERYRERMMKPEEVAGLVYEISRQPASMIVEEVVLRPQGGDLRV